MIIYLFFKLTFYHRANVVNLQINCLKIIGNIVTGNPLQTQAVIDSGVLTYLGKLIFHEKKTIRKESCWVISNIAAGTQQQIKALIVNDFLPILEHVIKNDEPEVINILIDYLTFNFFISIFFFHYFPKK